jgi:hypothetical protein
MPKASFAERLRYRFENSLSHGPIAIIAWLALISFVVVVLAALLLHFTGIGPAPDEKFSFAEAAWQSLMRALDSGAVGGDSGWVLRGIMLLVTIGGIFILSTLIGSISISGTGVQSHPDSGLFFQNLFHHLRFMFGQ